MMGRFSELADLLASRRKIAVIIANNPDADSVGSALALAEIFAQIGKEVFVYCRATIPTYLRFLEGWSEIQESLSNNYDLAVMVDNSSLALLEDDGNLPSASDILRSKPLVILDHHRVESDIDFASLTYNHPEMAATGQLIYNIAQELDWPLEKQTATYLAASILSDSLGFTSQVMLQNSAPLRVVADLVDLGVDLNALALRRLHWQEIPARLVSYRGELLQRIEFYEKEQVAMLTIEYEEIKKLGSLFNPTIVLDELRLVENLKLTLGFKKYQRSGGGVFRVTLRIRCYHRSQIAHKLANSFGGGGHPYAAGAKWQGAGLDFMAIKEKVLAKAGELLKAEAEADIAS